jgi:hypothetical protein
MLMNNRFVVPGMVDNVTKFGSLHDALTTPGLHAGDVIQIEPNSSPGQLFNADIPALKNLTIQGNPAYDVQSIPYLSVSSYVSIEPAQQGFALKNVQVDIQDSGLEFDADGTITGCRIKYEGGAINADAVSFVGTSTAVISDSYFESSDPQNGSDALLYMQPANGSQNRIIDNQFFATAGNNIDFINYSGGAGITDAVAHNTFLSNSNGTSIDIDSSEGLTVQGNTFTDSNLSPGDAIAAIRVQNLQILDNVISSPHGSEGIYVYPDQTSAPLAVVIAKNHINTGNQGTGIDFYAGSPGSSIVAKVEDNDLQGNEQGVYISKGSGGSVGGIDLGGGAQGSLGGNDFRGDWQAIYVSAPSAAAPSIHAQMNIFGVADPTTIIHDQHNNPTLAAVVSSNPLTGNAAFVETLYLDFLHRTGDLSNPNDAGSWVTRLGKGMPAATVADLVARSPEALGIAIDGLYHRFLGRAADAAGRANFVAYLQAGGTLEGVSQLMLASSEYQSRFPTDSSYVQSLYQNLLHRTGSTAEVNGWVAKLPQLGRASVAHGFLLSQEYRTDEVSDDYTWFLHRAGSAAEINSWVNGGNDLLTIDSLFAGSTEFQQNG